MKHDHGDDHTFLLTSLHLQMIPFFSRHAHITTWKCQGCLRPFSSTTEDDPTFSLTLINDDSSLPNDHTFFRCADFINLKCPDTHLKMTTFVLDMPIYSTANVQSFSSTTADNHTFSMHFFTCRSTHTSFRL